ncbi:uncharacterized [Tachysurus ichikawai]
MIETRARTHWCISSLSGVSLTECGASDSEDQRDTTRIVSARQGLEWSPHGALIGSSRRKSGRPVQSGGVAHGRRGGQSQGERGGVKNGARTE